MFSTIVDIKDIQEIRKFLESDECHLVDDMNRAGLSFGAMALVIQGIENICNEVEKELIKED
jgi:uncharacterized protein (UPF0305 family)